MSLLLVLLGKVPPTAAQVLSPGRLSRAHAPLEARCESCHGDDGVEPRRCLACHRELARRVRAGKGYHGRGGRGECSRCHTEHHGADTQLIRWPAGQDHFNHLETGYALEGKHATLRCRQCHLPRLQQEPAVKRLRPAHRARTFLGLWPECVYCHRDPHEGQLGSKCESCHTPLGFKPVRAFSEHDRTRYPLRGKHREVTCARCHKPNAKVWRFAGLSFESCASCHRSPHQSGGSKHAVSFSACDSCHSEESWSKTRYARGSHPSTLPLKGAHARVSCRACHGRSAKLTPTSTACKSCHRDPHQRRFGERCERCHAATASSWRLQADPPPLAPVAKPQRTQAEALGLDLKLIEARAFHNKTRFALEGRHMLVPCEGCHGKGRRRRYRLAAFGRCSDCHADVHRGELTRPNQRRPQARRCEDCHQTLGWELVRFSLQEHDQTRFALRGAHRAVACRSCHGSRRPPGRRFSYRDAQTCTDCHRDPHQGRYRLRASDAALACTSCHDEHSFTQLVYDHGKTKLPLRGAHAKAACASCHRSGRGGIVAFAELEPRCASCHRDPHQGQFSLGLGPAPSAGRQNRDCGACHSDAESSFKLARFDHDRLTRFPLTGRHRDLRCEACHHKVSLADGKEVRLYRLASRACGSCHDSPHRQPRPRQSRSSARHQGGETVGAAGARTGPAGLRRSATPDLDQCEQCHSSAGWLVLEQPSSFDHDRVGYPLRGAHRNVACATCHRAGRRIGRTCSVCHTDPHAGQLGDGCAECHRDGSWQPSSLLAQHRRTRLPLTGQHALADCASCHPRARERIFRGVPAACYGCHAPDYHDPSTHPDHVAQGFDRRCELCHRPNGWRPAALSSIQARLLVHRRFELTGAHASLPCMACHQGGGRLSSRCASCHYERARVVSAPDHSAPGFSSQCELCHEARSWRPARVAQHDKRFPLTGPHREAGCADCHSDSTSFAAVRCAGACHSAEALRVRHGDVSGFVLEARACLRCHPRGRRF